jgi:hypothetical protein
MFREINYNINFVIGSPLVPWKVARNEHAAWIQERGTKPFEYHLPLEFITEKTPRTWTEKLF